MIIQAMTRDFRQRELVLFNIAFILKHQILILSLLQKRIYREIRAAEADSLNNDEPNERAQ